MNWAAFFLGVLTLTAGCVVEEKRLVPPDAGIDAGLCDGCTAEAPICNEQEECVECTAGAGNDALCLSRSEVCDTEQEICVECLGDADCTSPDAAHCVSQQCVPCNDSAQCNGVDGLPDDANVCDDGECVDCTPETEAESCLNDRSCNPRTNECTDTVVGSVGTCEPCVADSECGDEGTPSSEHRCVEMYYPLGIRFPDDKHGFCLNVFSLGGCEQPYAIRLSDGQSLSGDPLDDYCGITQSLATCPAVRALEVNDTCENGEDGDCPESGLCRSVGGLPNRCTYRCTDDVECKEPGLPGSRCGSSGSGGDDYCGGG